MPPRRASARNASAAPAAASSASSSSSLFAGLTIAVAGKFSRPLAELKEIVTSNGGSAVSTQTKACTHLLADALGSAKTDKAVAAGVAVVTEEWLLQSAKKGKLLIDPKLMLSPPDAAEGGDEPAAAAAAAAAATPKRKRGEDAEESADAADADEADGDNSASAAASAAPAAKKQKGTAAAAAAEPAAASASSSAAAAAAPAPTSFSGKKFIVMGGFSAGKFKVESAISTHGGELTTSVLKSLDYCVYGTPVSTDYGGVSGPGSKKYKEAKKLKRVTMLNEEEFFKLVAAMEAAKKAGGAGAAGAAGAGAGSSSGGAGGDDKAHPIVAEFKEILALLGASDVKLEPATLSSITAAEDEMRMAIPPPLKALLLHVADGSQSLDSEKVGDLPYFWPSVSDIREQFSYNPYLPIIYRDCKWMPFHMLDYDFCWNVIDIPTGSILQVDAECNSNRDLGYTFEGHISNFKRFLEERKEKEKNKPAATEAAAAAAAAGAGAEGEAASSGSSSSRGPSLADEFNASPLSGQSRGMGYTQVQKYYKAYKKAERSQ